MDQFGSPAQNGAGHEGRWHKTAPRAPNGQHLPTPWEPPTRNEPLTGSWKRFLLAVLAQLVAPGTRVPLDTGDSPTGTWGMGLGQTWPGFPPPRVSKPSTGLLDKELGTVRGDEGSPAVSAGTGQTQPHSMPGEARQGLLMDLGFQEHSLGSGNTGSSSGSSLAGSHLARGAELLTARPQGTSSSGAQHPHGITSQPRSHTSQTEHQLQGKTVQNPVRFLVGVNTAQTPSSTEHFRGVSQSFAPFPSVSHLESHWSFEPRWGRAERAGTLGCCFPLSHSKEWCDFTPLSKSH